ncbi:MAG: hypothetical protein HYZ34_09390, partial [Ignavibacteriae bacterium]|nr:hypothetical protein [Ignavibacteriota bacterium]
MYRLIILILLVAALIPLCPAQQDDIKITRIGVEEGLTQSQVTSLGQDSDGFIWIGTIDGLYRYDGFTFKAFRHNPFDSASLQSNHITAVYGDRHGMVWILTAEGLSMFNTATERMRRYNISFPFRYTPDYFGKYYEDSVGRVWINVGTELYVYEHAHDSMQRIKVPQRKRKDLRFNPRKQIIEAKNHPGEYYVTNDSGLFMFRWNSKRFTPMKFHGDEYSISQTLPIFMLVQDSRGTPIVLTNKTLNVLNRLTGIPKQYALPDEFLSRSEPISNMHAFVDNTDKVWVLRSWTETGIACFDLQTLTWTYTDHFMEHGKRVPIRSLSSVLQNENGDIWLNSEGKEIFRFSQRTATWKKYEHEPLNPHSLSGNTTDFFSDNAGINWVGTNGNGLNKIEYQPVKFRSYREFQDGVRSIQLNDTRAFSANTKALWVGTLNDGLVRLDQTMNVRERYS